MRGSLNWSVQRHNQVEAAANRCAYCDRIRIRTPLAHRAAHQSHERSAASDVENRLKLGRRGIEAVANHFGCGEWANASCHSKLGTSAEAFAESHAHRNQIDRIEYIGDKARAVIIGNARSQIHTPIDLGFNHLGFCRRCGTLKIFPVVLVSLEVIRIIECGVSLFHAPTGRHDGNIKCSSSRHVTNDLTDTSIDLKRIPGRTSDAKIVLSSWLDQRSTDRRELLELSLRIKLTHYGICPGMNTPNSLRISSCSCRSLRRSEFLSDLVFDSSQMR